MRRGIAFLVLAAGLVALAVTTTRVRTDITDFFFRGDDADSAFLVGQLQSDELARRYLLGFAHPGLDATARLDFLADLRRRLAADPAVAQVGSGRPDLAQLRRLLRVYAPHHVHLYSLQPEQDFDALFDQAGLDARAAQVRAALLGPDPALAKSLLRDDPMLLTLDWLRRLGAHMSRPRQEDDYSVLLVDTRLAGTDVDAQARFQARLRSLFRAAAAPYGDAIHMQVTGVPVFAAHIKQAVAQDIRRVSALSVAAIAALFLLLFRSGRALAVTAVLMLVTVAVAVLATGLVFGAVHGLTLALGATLIGVCIDYPVHALVHAGGAAGAGAVRRIWPAMILAGLTTLIGYLALAMSGFPGLQQIALFSAAGILTALLLTRYVLPDLIGWLRPGLRPRLDAGWLLSDTWTRRLRPLTLSAAALLALAGISQVHWQSDLDTLTPDLQQLRDQDRAIRARLVAVEPGRFLLAEGADAEQALQVAEQAVPRLQALREAGALDAFFPLWPLLASQALQNRNSAAWNARLDDAARARWRQALKRQRLAAAAFPPLRPDDRPPLRPAELRDTPAWPLVSHQIVPGQGRVSVVTWLGRHDPARLRELAAGLPGLRYFSQKDAITRLASRYRERAAAMLLAGLAVIATLLALRYRSVWRGLRVLAPAALSLAVVTGAWGLAGVPLGMLHLVGLLLAAAICVDYGIFFAENRSGDRRLTFRAITVSALTSAVSFGALAAAANPALHALAGTVAPGVLLGFLFCPVLLRERVSR